MNRTYNPKTTDISEKWYIINARGRVLGRVASEAARILRGKHRPCYAPYMDLGDHVIIVNAEGIRVTGKKPLQKRYYRHSNYPGGLKQETLRDVMAKDPSEVIRRAIVGMLPHNSLGRKLAKKLRVYTGEEHPHTAQMPEPLPENLKYS